MAFKEDIPLHVMPKLSIQSFLEKLNYPSHRIKIYPIIYSSMSITKLAKFT
jgi:hypothetical protein